MTVALKKILVVDDAETSRTIIKIGLERRPDWEVRLARTGQEALEMASEWIPDVVLLDVVMPQMDGKATFKGLREKAETASIPVIFMTSKGRKEIDKCLECGSCGYLAKPFDPFSLGSDIEKILKNLAKQLK